MGYLPINLIFARHGETEHNSLVHKIYNEGLDSVDPEILKHHEASTRLTELGKDQARAIGSYLNEQGWSPDYFITSPYPRAKETASFLAVDSYPESIWSVDYNLRERDWGFGSDASKNPEFKKQRTENYFLWKPSNTAESFTDCQVRAELFLQHFDRHQDQHTSLCVSHNEYIMSMMALIEKDDMDMFNEKYSPGFLPNGVVVIYTRKNPVTGEISSFYNFRKVVCPWDEEQNKDAGEWVQFTRPKYTPQELIASIKSSSPFSL